MMRHNIFYTIQLFCFIAVLDAIYEHPGSFNMTEPSATAGIFATYPAPHLTLVNGFFDQVLFYQHRQNIQNLTVIK